MSDTSDGEKYGCATSDKILMNTNDGLFPQWAWDTNDDGVLVARWRSEDTETMGETAYRLLMQAFSDPTANVERVCPRVTPFEGDGDD